MYKLGVIINPIAGIGGRVGLKGSDGRDIVRRALEKGARPEASARALEALSSLRSSGAPVEVMTCPGEMGADVCRTAGWDPKVIGKGCPAGRTTALDTEKAAREMRAAKVDLLMFAGGDGTARNICGAVGEDLPVLGVPAGVKIQSAVFAITPKSAGHVAADFLKNEPRQGRCRIAEVVDIDEAAFREGRVMSRLYGTLRVPDCRSHVQGAKIGSIPSEQELLQQISQTVVAGMTDENCHYIIGPGTTTRAIMDMLGLDHTLLGVDVVKNRQLAALDVDESRLLQIAGKHPCKIVVTIIGGQGYLFGRGNQQISPAVIRAVGLENVRVIATPEKLLGLGGSPLLVDTGDSVLDRNLAGYIRVVTGLDTYSMYRVGRK